jgi:hypothetical protein
MAEIINENYGVADTKREKRRKRVVIVSLLILIAAAVTYFALRTRSQEKIVAQFLETLQEKRYQDAYKMWGESKNYPPESFLEDWGPTSQYSNAAALKVQNVDYCDTGVVFNVTYPQQEAVGLWVERSTGVISFTPSDWLGRCPGRHLQLGAFLHRLFSSGASN